MERYFFASLLSAMDIVFLSHFGNISRQTSLKALQNVFLACLSDSLDEIAFSVSIGKSKSMIGRNGSSPSIISCREYLHDLRVLPLSHQHYLRQENVLV